MPTMTKPSTMNPKQSPSHAGFRGVSPAPSSRLRYPRYPVVKPQFRGSFDWRHYPGLF